MPCDPRSRSPGPEDALSEAQPLGPAFREGTPPSRSIHTARGSRKAGGWGEVQTPEGRPSNHPTRTHHAAPRSPRVCARAAGKPTRAVQSGLRVTKSRAGLRPAQDRRAYRRTHPPSGLLTKFESSLPSEGRDADCAAAPKGPVPWGAGSDAPVRGAGHATLPSGGLAGAAQRGPGWGRRCRKRPGGRGCPSLQPQPGGTPAHRSREGTGLDWPLPTRNLRPRRAISERPISALGRREVKAPTRELVTGVRAGTARRLDVTVCGCVTVGRLVCLRFTVHGWLCVTVCARVSERVTVGATSLCDCPLL